METQRIRIFLHDEAPRIGCGWRTVTVMLGRKWVRLVDERTLARCRMMGSLWRDLAMYGKPLPPRKRKRQRRAVR